MDRVVLEILVDRNNLKGPGVFEHILIILHKVFEDFENSKKLKKTGSQPTFSFEITKVGNRIRFFVVSPKKYANFLSNQIYAHYTDVEIFEVGDYLENIPDEKIHVGKIKLSKHIFYPIKSFTELQEEASQDMVDPFSSMTSSLSKTGKYTLNTFQVNFTPIKDSIWKKDQDKIIDTILSSSPDFMKKILLSDKLIFLKIIFSPIIFINFLIKLFLKKGEKETGETLNNEKDTSVSFMKNKLKLSGYKTSINIIHAGEDRVESKGTIREIFSTLSVFSYFGLNSLDLEGIYSDEETIYEIKNRKANSDIVLSTNELSGLVHLPTSYVKTPQINWVSSRAFEPPGNLPILNENTSDNKIEEDLTPIGKTNFRGTNQDFGIGPNDRRRHMYVLGKTGMGKSTLLENMIIDDIRKGRGVAVIDPHGDLAESVIGFIPKSRTNQTIIFDPSDTSWPIAFNMLENVNPELRPLVASGLVGIFKKIFGDSWGPRLEYILRNTILALLEYPNTTLISIPLMLTSEVYRNKVVNKIKDPVVKKFWTGEFAKMAPNQRNEAIGPILNKVGQFLSSSILRNVLGQPKNSFDIRWAMDNKKIIIVNLSKGKIGEDASALLGAMLVTKFQIDAMSRSDTPESKRQDFYLYVDEFQNFATDSFATILSEARKYKLNLVMANQYVDQMQESVKGAVFGNVGSVISFQVGYHDANILKEVLAGNILEDDLMNLKKYNIYTKQLIDGMPSQVFSAATFAPNHKNESDFQKRYQKILQVSREKYCKSKQTVEEKIYSTIDEIDKLELAWEKKKQEFKEQKKQENKK